MCLMLDKRREARLTAARPNTTSFDVCDMRKPFSNSLVALKSESSVTMPCLRAPVKAGCQTGQVRGPLYKKRSFVLSYRTHILSPAHAVNESEQVSDVAITSEVAQDHKVLECFGTGAEGHCYVLDEDTGVVTDDAASFVQTGARPAQSTCVLMCYQRTGIWCSRSDLEAQLRRNRCSGYEKQSLPVLYLEPTVLVFVFRLFRT